MLEVDSNRLDLGGVEVNASLDAVDVRLLQLLIAQTSSTHSLREQRLLVERHVVPALRQVRRTRRPLRVPERLRAAMRLESLRQIEGIQATGCQVHGDLDELMADDCCFASVGGRPEEVRVEDLLPVIIEALAAAFPVDRPAPGGDAPVR